MMAMSYDSDLEFTAQCQAAKCIYDHDAECFRTEMFSEVGQNLNGRVYEEGDNRTFGLIEETKKMVSEWYEYEITESNEKVFQDFSRLKAVLIGYLYQMIWAETYRVGCGRSIQEKKYYMMICNYGPRGLRVTKPLGRIGRPCTKCPETISCNQAYPGLCGEIDESHYSVTVSGGVNIICSSLNLRIVLFCLVITTTSM
ncbi:unnamed protein product [Acanthoscelides obtectus]|nr:unnamed protein product [Acanthoscelides obtectus]CAK1648123.1 hypothetical protein AOBTE_LOCUS15547 [Acanthoscelides obtectus]